VHYDLILMDIQMPRMDGLEATRGIRFSLSERRPRIVALTAAPLDDERQRCIEAGMDDYIAKPITAEKVASMLERASPPPPAPARASPTGSSPEPEGRA